MRPHNGAVETHFYLAKNNQSLNAVTHHVVNLVKKAAPPLVRPSRNRVANASAAQICSNFLGVVAAVTHNCQITPVNVPSINTLYRVLSDNNSIRSLLGSAWACPIDCHLVPATAQNLSCCGVVLVSGPPRSSVCHLVRSAHESWSRSHLWSSLIMPHGPFFTPAAA